MSRGQFEKWVKDTYRKDSGLQMMLLDAGRFFEVWQARQTEIDALIHDNARLLESLNTEAKERCRLEDENATLKAEVERLRKPVLPPWSPDYGSGPVTPDKIYQYFSDGAWYDCKKMDLGFYIADNVPIRELFTRPIQTDAATLHPPTIRRTHESGSGHSTFLGRTRHGEN